jgi:hypothetical protein
MAKALYGHVGSAPDKRLLDEVTRLRSRVRDLEVEVMRLRAENDRLVAAVADSDDLLRIAEPALAEHSARRQQSARFPLPATLLTPRHCVDAASFPARDADRR